MRDHRLVRSLKAGLVALLACSGMEAYANDFSALILAAHNRERHSVGVAPLRWSSRLSESAKQWADYLATGKFEHAPESLLKDQGENIWAGTRGHYSVPAMVEAWAREKRVFKSGTFPDNSITGNVEDVGHYTQLVWRTTNEVGCALAKSVEEDILVCRYGEAGNYRGEMPF